MLLLVEGETGCPRSAEVERLQDGQVRSLCIDVQEVDTSEPVLFDERRQGPTLDGHNLDPIGNAGNLVVVAQDHLPRKAAQQLDPNGITRPPSDPIEFPAS